MDYRSNIAAIAFNVLSNSVSTSAIIPLGYIHLSIYTGKRVHFR